MKSFRSLIAALGALALAASSFAQTPAEPTTVPTSSGATSMRPGPKPGEMAPDFTVIGPDGKEVKLSDFRGKIVMLDIWATWCGPCVASMPHNSEMAEKFAKDGLVILAVCADDSRANYDSWVKRNGTKYKFLTAHDTPGKDGWKDSVFNTKYGVTGFPTIFLIDREGKLVGTTGGGGPTENPYVTRLLAKGGIPIDTSHLPPEPTGERKVIAASTKTMATATGGASVPMMGGGMAMARSASGDPLAGIKKFGSVEAGQPVPDFTVTGSDGQPLKFSSFKGKPTFVAFWTGARMPGDDVAQLAAAYKDQGLAVLAINIGTDKAEFEQWYAANKDKLGFQVAWDPAGKAFMESISYMQFSVGMYPAYFTAKADGTLGGGVIGMGDRVSSLLRAMVIAAGVKPTEDDLALVRKYVAAELAKSPGGMTAAKPAAGGGGMTAATRVPTLKAGDVAPDFTMQDVNGKEVKLSDFKDKIVILDFWATWCGPCIASFPHTQKVAAQYKDQGVVVVASGTSDTIAKFKEWIPKNQSKYPDLQFFFDANERGSKTFDERASNKFYHVVGIPTQFVIGRDGKIAATIVGNGGEEDARTEAALASLGVKVDAAIVAKGKASLAEAEAADKEREAEAAEELKTPKPYFKEVYGKLKAGEPVPDIVLQTVDGQEAKFSELTKGKTVVFSTWSANNGPSGEPLEFQEAWAKRYADQGVVFLGLGAYGSREDFDKWRADNAGKFSFPVVFDPAGKPPAPPKPMDEMNDEEKKAFQAASREHYGKIAPLKFTGGAMAPVPNNVVVDSQGRMLGFYVGAGAGSKDSLANLLLRAGIKLAPEDMPRKVFTAADTKEAPPEARKETIKIGAMAPDFTTQDAAGKDVKISDFKGKVVILDFWATWCGPCMAAMPHTQEVAAQYKDQDVVVLGSCTSDTRAKFESWVKTNLSKYPDMIWTHDKAERTPERASYKLYGVSGIPTQFIIDREGKIVDIVVGYLKGEAILDGALAKAGVKVDPALVEKAKADLAKRQSMSQAAPTPAPALKPAPAKS